MSHTDAPHPRTCCRLYSRDGVFHCQKVIGRLLHSSGSQSVDGGIGFSRRNFVPADDGLEVVGKPQFLQSSESTVPAGRGRKGHADARIAEMIHKLDYASHGL